MINGELSPSTRYHYEAILPTVPCHFYLDLEADITKDNLMSKVVKIYKKLLNEIRSFLYKQTVAPIDKLNQMKLVILDSSTRIKFSKHVIIKIPGCMFENNYYCGAFMRQFLSHIIDNYGPSSQNPFFVTHFTGPKGNKIKTYQLMADMGVYTKARDFRLLGSHKRGPIYKEKRFLWIEGHPRELDKNNFFNSLVQFTIEKPAYIIKDIEDPLTGGSPVSSSLRTVEPKNSYSAYATSNVTIDTTLSKKRKVSPIKESKDVQTTDKLEVMQKVGLYIQNRFSIKIVKIEAKGKSLFFQTNSRNCAIKKQILREHTHLHPTRHGKSAPIE